MKSHASHATQTPTLSALGLGKSSSGADTQVDAASSVAAVGRGASLTQGMAAGLQTVGAGNAFATDLATAGLGGGDDAEGIGGYAAKRPEEQSEEEKAEFQEKMSDSFGTGGDGDGPAEPPASPADGGSAEVADAPAGGEEGGSVEIDVANHRPAPTGDDFNRTVVGVGEETTFWASREGGTWSSSGGTGAPGPDGEYEWTAPSTAAGVTITYTLDDAVSSVSMAVLPPMAMTSTLIGANNASQVPGEAGAGMDLSLTIHPLNVSFYNVQWLEQPGPAAGKWGYFSQATDAQLTHSPNTQWLNMGADNNALTDTAAYFGAPSPFSEGGFVWVVPNLFRVGGEGGGTFFFPSVQLMTIAADGTATVSKFSNSISRSP